jgi:DNA-binding FrmR family transcriptional regulator
MLKYTRRGYPEMKEELCPKCHEKATKRSEELIKSIDSRINRIIGQLNGIKKMVDENRYCGDVLTQIASVESAIQSVGYLILEDHMESCVKEKIVSGDEKIIGETIDLIKKLK